MSKENQYISGNIGEWSELYVLIYILLYSGLYGADKEQNQVKELFYEVYDVIIEDGGSIRYKLEGDSIKIIKKDELIKIINKNNIYPLVESLFNNLVSFNEGRAFSLEIGDKILSLLERNSIKASSKVKSDIALILKDFKTKLQTPIIGFSIKSQLGSPSTLVNASKATNFIYEVVNKDQQKPLSLPDMGLQKVKDNVRDLISLGYDLKFSHIESDIFSNNLKYIDTFLPNNLSQILLSYYKKEGTAFSELVEHNFNQESDRHIIFKLKEFLSTMALGMMPNTHWDGSIVDLGGLILVKRNGEVLCYYIYNMNDFQSYLLQNLKLDTPSTSRYGIGVPWEENGKVFIKLNLQVRFIK